MAEPIEYHPPKYDRRRELLHRLEQAPLEHVEALLDGYEILNLLREKGILELAKGALGSGEKLLEVATKTVETQEAVNTFRNLIIVTKIFGSINPEFLENLGKSLLAGVSAAKRNSPPGLFRIMKGIFSKNGRRLLHAVSIITQSMGAHLHTATADALRGKKRERTIRHTVSCVDDSILEKK